MSTWIYVTLQISILHYIINNFSIQITDQRTGNLYSTCRLSIESGDYFMGCSDSTPTTNSHQLRVAHTVRT
jgi:hypothetical protein